jgi:hypothetical protein
VNIYLQRQDVISNCIFNQNQFLIMKMTSKLKKGILACGAAMLLAGFGTELSAQLYTDGGTVGSTTGAAVGTGYVGIGAAVPARQLEIANTSTAVNNTWFMVTNISNNGTGSSPGFNMRKARGGNVSTPTAVTNGDRLGFFLAAGHDGTNYLNASGMTFKVDGAVSTGVMPADVQIETGAPRVTKFRVASSGKVYVTDLGAFAGEYVMIGAGGELGHGVPAGGTGGSNWDSPAMAGSGEGHIWFSQGADAMADTIAVAIDFSIAQDNSEGLEIWYSGADGSWDPVGMYSNVDAGAGFGIAAATWGGWMGAWLDGNDFSFYANNDAFIQGNLTVSGTITQASDQRLKENIQDMNGALENIMQLQPRTYNYINNGMNLPQGESFGFLAQELQEVFPNLVVESTSYGSMDKDSKFDFLTVNYIGLVPVMVSAIQEQQNSINNLSERLDQVEELLKKKK